MLPISLTPIYQTRIWGGRHLETEYQRQLPDNQPYGESWEISDRIDEQSQVVNGKFSGKTLHELWSMHREEIFGKKLPDSERFPLLIKILDARSDLSIQVHPPEAKALTLNGEPKTEMWYIAHADQNAKLYVGLKHGVTKEDFETAVQHGTVEQLVHAIEPKQGESIFIESGRLHAIGAGLLIYEIQQNSDTTYRVFDWNRLGLDGKPRDLHVKESLSCIDFNDYEPEMTPAKTSVISDCEYFKVEERQLDEGSSFQQKDSSHFAIITVVKGTLTDKNSNTYSKGDFFILPVGAENLTASTNSIVLETSIPL